jgi:hypothetical protein
MNTGQMGGQNRTKRVFYSANRIDLTEEDEGGSCLSLSRSRSKDAGGMVLVSGECVIGDDTSGERLSEYGKTCSGPATLSAIRDDAGDG